MIQKKIMKGSDLKFYNYFNDILLLTKGIVVSSSDVSISVCFSFVRKGRPLFLVKKDFRYCHFIFCYYLG